VQHKLRGAIGSGTAIVINLLIFTVPLLALVFDWSTFRLAMLISLLGVLAKVAGITETSRERPKVITTLAWVAIVMSTLSAYHRDSWGVFHLPIAILLLLPIFWAARTRGVQIKWAFWGACGGALLGAIVALQYGALSGSRNISFFNPIPAGGIALVLACGSGLALPLKPPRISKAGWTLICSAGIIAGIFTSLMSGSKAGWLAIPAAPCVLLFLNWQRLSSREKLRSSTLFLIITVGTLIAVYVSPAWQRLQSAVHGAVGYAAGSGVTEGSVGPRLELWRYALEHIGRHPLIGVGKDALISDFQTLAANGIYAQVLTQLHTMHNEFLHVYMTHGILGLSAMVLVYLSLFRLSHGHEERAQASVSMMAACIAVIYLCLGVGEVALQLRDLRNPFLFWVILLAAQPRKTRI